jgi:dihydropteroate synthase
MIGVREAIGIRRFAETSGPIMAREHIHFVTGRLAERALRRVVEPLATEVGFDYSIDVLPITVAALMTPAWIARHCQLPPAATRVLLPGYCDGDLAPVASLTIAAVERGPRDLVRLPAYFSCEAPRLDYGSYDIEIVAEINHCPRLPLAEVLSQAASLARDGADVIDVGCDPGNAWPGVGDAVRALREAGHRVSIDSLNPREIAAAAAAGAELVLCVNSTNRSAAADWGIEVVAVPDDPRSLAGLDDTVDFLARGRVPLRIDPVLEPIGFGFAASLGRYVEVRRRYPDAEMLMGVGNLTELTDVDSGGVNALLLGFCQEQAIRSVLTTQVINWARSSIRECDVARRLMYHAVSEGVLPKHVDPRLVMLRDPEVAETPLDDIAELARQLRDNNYRLFAAEGEVHLTSAALHLHSADPFELMEQLRTSGPEGTLPKNLDAGHAFYLGYEMCKAAIALTLGKTYRQDEALEWGLATRRETRHYLKRGPNLAGSDAEPTEGGRT